MSKLTVLTFNIDGREHNYEQRLGAFVESVKISNPDLVAVQEGTRITYEIILRKLGELGYKRFLPEQVHYRANGEALFSKYPISETTFLPFPKGTDKKGLTMAKIDVWGEPDIWFVTSQFDDSVTLKRQQIASLPKLLKNHTGILFFAGDTRILDYQNDLHEPDGWFDAWYESGSTSQKYSYDSNSNPLAITPIRDRPDRIWFYSDGRDLDCKSCKLLGQESSIAISSHYGVLAEFELNI